MKYTDRIPLRRSSAWPAYAEDVVLPRVYGRVTLKPIRYLDTADVWLIADHPIAGVDAVTLEGQPYGGATFSNELDPTGAPVALLTVRDSDATDFTVTVRGAIDPATGVLLETPAQILDDILGGLCGLPVDLSRLDDLRTLSPLFGPIAGVVDTGDATLQSVIDGIASGCGLAWGPTLPGLAMPWPPLEAPAGGYCLTDSVCLSPSCESSHSDLATSVQVLYAQDWATGDCTSSVAWRSQDALDRPHAPTETVTLTAPWLRTAEAADAYAKRWLAWHSAPQWTVTATLPPGSVTLGERISLQHRLILAAAGLVARLSSGMIDEQVEIVCIPAAVDSDNLVRVI